MTQDEIFAEKALDLAGTAAMALEEAYSYVDNIKDPQLRKETREKVENIVEFL